MSDSFRFWMMLLVGVVVLYVAYKLVIGLISGLLSLIMPIAIIGGIGYVLYLVISKKALGGGRGILP